MNGIAIHVNPMASDGQWTIGTDDDRLAGQWPGNMEETTGDRDFMIARDGAIWCDGNQNYQVVDDEWVVM